eukprot:g36164.t1
MDSSANEVPTEGSRQEHDAAVSPAEDAVPVEEPVINPEEEAEAPTPDQDSVPFSKSETALTSSEPTPLQEQSQPHLVVTGLRRTSHERLREILSQFGELTVCTLNGDRAVVCFKHDSGTSAALEAKVMEGGSEWHFQLKAEERSAPDSSITSPLGQTEAAAGDSSSPSKSSYSNAADDSSLPRDASKAKHASPLRSSGSESRNRYGDQAKLFVANVSPLSSEELRKGMERFGAVSDAVVMPGGFGFCTFESSEGTEAALAAGELVLHGRAMEIQKAKPKRGQATATTGLQRGGRDARDRPRGRRGMPEEPKLYIGNLPAITTNTEFHSALSQFGKVADCVVMNGGFGFCTFAGPDGTDNAMRGSLELHGRILTIEYARPKDKSGGGGGGRPPSPRSRRRDDRRYEPYAERAYPSRDRYSPRGGGRGRYDYYDDEYEEDYYDSRESGYGRGGRDDGRYRSDYDYPPRGRDSYSRGYGRDTYSRDSFGQDGYDREAYAGRESYARDSYSSRYDDDEYGGPPSSGDYGPSSHRSRSRDRYESSRERYHPYRSSRDDGSRGGFGGRGKGTDDWGRYPADGGY